MEKLPVPPLDQTLTKWRKTLEPLCTPEELQSFDAQLKADYPKLKELHSRLVKHRDQQTPDNESWLSKWWLEWAYHSWREPVFINSNWFTVFTDHPSQPSDLLHPHTAVVPAGHFTAFQLHRCAGVVSNALQMHLAIQQKRIPQEFIQLKGDQSKRPLCMRQYDLMFGLNRVPKIPCDSLVDIKTGRHIMVMVRDQIYPMEVFDATTGSLFTVETYEKKLWAIVNDAMNTPAEPPIGLMGADHRDNWSKAYAHLWQLSEDNRKNMDVIHQALFCLCIDDWSGSDTFDNSFELMAHSNRGRNRWYDKAISVCCMNNGRAGMTGEHSPCDALIPSRMMDWLVSREPAKDPANSVTQIDYSVAKKLRWDVDSVIQKAIRNAQSTADALIANSDAKVLIFTQYGSDFIKQFARVSPDAFFQMALQLAYYKLHGSFTATYETASTRLFKDGRTECIRTCSTDSVAFVKSMVDPLKSAEAKVKALQTACYSHSQFTTECMRGQGIDRHLLGMRLCLQSGESCPLLTSNQYAQRSTYFRLSTSGLSSGEYYNGTGFGAVVPDGYGINYCIGKKAIKLGIESKKMVRITSSSGFRRSLVEALMEMRSICTAPAVKL